MYRNFQFSWSQMCLFFPLVTCVLGIIFKMVSLPNPKLWTFYPTLFSPKSFIVLGLTFRCLTHFELRYIYDVRWDPASFCMWISSVPNTIYWKVCPFPIKWSWTPCPKQHHHICNGLFLGSLFYFIGLYVCFIWYHTIFITVAL